MAGQNSSLINRLEREFPEGLLADTAWFGKQGFSRQLLNHYVNTGWLEQPARGVYRRPRGALTWQQVVISLQTLLQLPVAVGGQTALEMQGYAHYLSFNLREVHLYSAKDLPKWVGKLDLAVRFVRHEDKRLFRNEPIHRALTNLSLNLKSGAAMNTDPIHGNSFNTVPWGQWDWPLTLSTVERAYLELLDEVPKRVSFDLADKLMEGLTSLSPRRLQKLLVDCKSVKVKRLFFFFADRHEHAWLKHLKMDAIDLGKGKRMLATNGRLDKTYQITVPEELYAAS
ncbi:MAG TPA: type IV toxin-antitoxin system AbiEi family antitoxin domain-containing protein [Rhizomicrobium sp.]